MGPSPREFEQPLDSRFYQQTLHDPMIPLPMKIKRIGTESSDELDEIEVVNGMP